MNTKKSVWQRILLSQHYRWSVWNFHIAAAMVNGCWLSKWHSLIFTLDEHESIWRPSDQATKPYLRAAFETVFKKELQKESSLNICRVVGNSFTCKVDLSVTFFLFFFSTPLFALFFKVICITFAQENVLHKSYHHWLKKKGKMGKNKYDRIFLQSNLFNVWRKKQMRMLNNLDEE